MTASCYAHRRAGGVQDLTERTQIGEFSKSVIETLSLNIAVGTPIYLGESNRKHMEKSHPSDFKKYGNRLERIISEPDYVGLRDDGSIEYVKTFGMHIKVAVRITSGGDYYARTLYHVDGNVAKRLVASNEWKSIKPLNNID